MVSGILGDHTGFQEQIFKREDPLTGSAGKQKKRLDDKLGKMIMDRKITQAY